MSDTRISAGDRDRSQYRFRLDRPGTARIGAVLVIRRTFPAWATIAGTDVGEIVIARRTVLLSR